jgi:hypothetical protein
MHAFEHGAELLAKVLFVNKIECARTSTNILELGRLVGRHQYHVRCWKPSGKKPRQRYTIQVRHVNVHQHQLRLEFEHRLYGLASFARAGDQVDERNPAPEARKQLAETLVSRLPQRS